LQTPHGDDLKSLKKTVTDHRMHCDQAESKTIRQRAARNHFLRVVFDITIAGRIKKAAVCLSFTAESGLYGIMQLRNHPFMALNDIPNWPPEWIWADGIRNAFIHPKGEVGILKNVRRSIINPNRCLLITIRHNGSVYLGHLTFDHEEFCHQLFEMLKANCGHTL